MKYFSMFSGIGGFELGIQRARPQWDCVGYSEIEPKAILTYQKNFPGHINYGDSTKINPRELPDFDLLCAGFPCQAFSGAGNRRGFKDTRGTLFFEITRIAAIKKPKYMLLENVKGLLNHEKGETFRIILNELGSLGYDVQWLVFDSYYYDAAPRERVYCFAYDRKLQANDLQRNFQTIQAYFDFRKRITAQDSPSRDKELGRNSARIIREFKQLPDWLDCWCSFYTPQEASGKRCNCQCDRSDNKQHT